MAGYSGKILGDGSGDVWDNVEVYLMKEEQKIMKIKRKLFLVIFAIILFYIFIGWKIPIALRMETLNLPKDCTTVYHTKVQISDVYWLHIKGEKVIKCDIGYEAVKEYIETHNSETALKYIDIYPYGGMSDIAIYDSQFDEKFWEQSDQESYITISYFRKLILSN